MNISKYFVLFILFNFYLIAHAECLDINGLSFEKIDTNKLLAIKGGKNIAVIRIDGTLPDKIGQFRFFSEQLCTSGAEDKFHIDGKLFYVGSYGIQLYK